MFRKKPKTEKNNKNGFTLIEILVVVSILVIVLVIIISAFPKFTKRYSMKSATDSVVSLLRTARLDTLSSKKDKVYGVHFNTDFVSMFPGEEYIEGSKENTKFNFPNDVIMKNISLSNGGEEIVFERLTGRAIVHGSTTISFSDTEQNATIIYIRRSGIIEVEN